MEVLWLRHCLEYFATKAERTVPAGEVDFIPSQVQVGVWKHRAYFIEQHAHELVAGVQHWVDRPERP